MWVIKHFAHYSSINSRMQYGITAWKRASSCSAGWCVVRKAMWRRLVPCEFFLPVFELTAWLKIAHTETKSRSLQRRPGTLRALELYERWQSHWWHRHNEFVARWHVKCSFALQTWQFKISNTSYKLSKQKSKLRIHVPCAHAKIQQWPHAICRQHR